MIEKFMASSNEQGPRLGVTAEAHNRMSLINLFHDVIILQHRVIFGDLHLENLPIRISNNEVLILLIFRQWEVSHARWQKCWLIQRVSVFIPKCFLTGKVPFGAILIVDFNKSDEAQQQVPLLIDVNIINVSALLVFGVPLDFLECYQIWLQWVVLEVTDLVDWHSGLKEAVLHEGAKGVALSEIRVQVTGWVACFQADHPIELLVVHF